MPRITADWAARPFDPKCRDRLPIDDVAVAQIRMVIADWSVHDWEAVFGRIAAEIPGIVPRLPTMTAREIGQCFHGFASRGRGMAHTANTSSTTLTMPDVAGTMAGEDARRAAESLRDTHWRILEVCVTQGFVDRASAETQVVITQHVFGVTGKPAKGHCGDLRRYFDDLLEHDFLCSQRGIGTFASCSGIDVWQGRRARQLSLG